MNHENISRWLARSQRPNGFAEIQEMKACIGTSLGEVRRENQDRAAVARFTSTSRCDKAFTCFVLCDGMGGMEDGSRCAEIAISAFILELVRDQSGMALPAATRAAIASNSAVYRQYRERGGTTLAALVFFDRSAAAVTVGDSRIYQIGDGKKPIQVSTDDTMEGELNRLIGRNPSLAKWDTFAGQLAQYIGIGEGLEPRTYNVNRSSPYLLTTDGIHGYEMSPTTLTQVVAASGLSQLLIRNLLHLSRMCGGVDNATAVFVQPLPSDWAEPPAYADGDWLEVWDAFGKLEFSLNQNSVPVQKVSTLGQASPKRPGKPTKTGKRIPPPKNEAPAEQESKRVSPAQGRLTIEIVDDNNRAAAKFDAENVNIPKLPELRPPNEELVPEHRSHTGSDSTLVRDSSSLSNALQPVENVGSEHSGPTEQNVPSEEDTKVAEFPKKSEIQDSAEGNNASQRE